MATPDRSRGTARGFDPTVTWRYGAGALAVGEESVPLVACPRCGEDEELDAVRSGDSDAVVEIVCGTCAHRWLRDTGLRCRLCGSADLRYTPKPLWEKGRGEQRTPAGRQDAYACWSCGGRDVTSSNPDPAAEGDPQR